MHPNQGNHLSKEAFTKCKLNWMIQPLKLWFKATGADNKREPVLKCCKAIVRHSFSCIFQILLCLSKTKNANS